MGDGVICRLGAFQTGVACGPFTKHMGWRAVRPDMPTPVTELRQQCDPTAAVTSGGTGELLLQELAENPETAYTPTELAARIDAEVTEAEPVLDRLVDTGVVHTLDGHYFVTDQLPGLQTALWDMYQVRLMRESTRQEEQVSAGEG